MLESIGALDRVRARIEEVVAQPGRLGEGRIAAPPELVEAFHAAFGEPDSPTRRDLLRRAWVVGGRYTSPAVDLDSREELLAYVGAFRERWPGARFVLTSDVDAHHRALRYSWQLRAPDGPVLLEGTSFGELAPGGRLARLVVFHGASADA